MERKKQKHKMFNFGAELVNLVRNSFAFIMALALNAAFVATFALIPVGDGVLGAWLYAIVIITIGILALYGVSFTGF